MNDPILTLSTREQVLLVHCVLHYLGTAKRNPKLRPDMCRLLQKLRTPAVELVAEILRERKENQQ